MSFTEGPMETLAGLILKLHNVNNNNKRYYPHGYFKFDKYGHYFSEA